LAEQLKTAVQTAVNDTLSSEVQEIVIKEFRQAFREHEGEFASIIRGAVAQAA
jgi:hypothetical protein